jgi:hypothetical protein
MSGYIFALSLSLVVVLLLVQLLRTRRIREKYAVIWIALAAAVILLGVFPGLAFWLAALVGVQAPVNLVFAIAFVVLLLVCLHLSTEVSSLEEETRTLAEEIALLRFDLRELSEATAVDRPDTPSTEPTDG